VKIGNLHINWMSYDHQLIIERRVAQTITTQPEPRMIIARMARSEVKNYLAELAEEAEVPFGNPAGFLRGIRTYLDGISSTTPLTDPDEPYDAAADAPFNVIDKITLHDTTEDREFCGATPDLPEEIKWPVCSLAPHEDDRHESADYYWIDGSPAVLMSEPVLVALSLKCRMYGAQDYHTPCSGTVDDGTGGACLCRCHGRFY
jgi:hypothetical protein